MTVAELEERLTIQEFWDWQKFASLEPFLPERVDLAGGLVTTMLANINRPKNRKAFSVSDFMIIEKGLKSQEATPPNPDDGDGGYMLSVILALGGKVE